MSGHTPWSQIKHKRDLPPGFAVGDFQLRHEPLWRRIVRRLRRR